jgi:hypothetical protein
MLQTICGATSAVVEDMRPASNDNHSAASEEWRRLASALPADATAVIEPADGGVTHPGHARKRWRLWFRSRVAPIVDPLTGWCGGEEPLAHLTLSFRRLADAISYCRRYGIRYDLWGIADSKRNRVEPSPYCRSPHGDPASLPEERRHAHAA